MAWVIDTCLILDVLDDDPSFGEVSAEQIDAHSSDGLTICPVTYVELAPAFRGQCALQDEFLAAIGVSFRQGWTWDDTLQAHGAWHAHILRRRHGGGPKRPLADLLIGSFAMRFQGLLTRNPGDFRTAFPELEIRVPGTGQN